MGTLLHEIPIISGYFKSLFSRVQFKDVETFPTTNVFREILSL